MHEKLLLSQIILMKRNTETVSTSIISTKLINFIILFSQFLALKLEMNAITSITTQLFNCVANMQQSKNSKFK